MPKPRIFISSTYLDLRTIRDEVHNWVEESAGFHSVAFEKGGVFFDPHKPIDESCYDEVSKCQILVSIIGRRYGAKATDDKGKKKGNILRYNSVTKKEFLKARECNIDTYIFVDHDVLQEHKTYLQNDKSFDINYQSVDDPNIFLLIDELYGLKFGNYIKDFKSADEIISYLREQWAYLFNDALVIRRDHYQAISNSKVNPYKMFYYRHQKKIDFTSLSKKTKIDRQRLERLERLKPSVNDWSNPNSFHNCPIDDIRKIEKALNCPRELKSGKDNDFSTEFIYYYREYKLGKTEKIEPEISTEKSFKHSAIVFDFDGTITIKNSNQIGQTHWESLWIELGYDVKLCSKYFNEFMDGKISHQQWCDITAKYFINQNLNTGHLDKIANKTFIVPNLVETLEYLKKLNIKMFITSGSILYIIKKVLGKNINYFDDICANDMEFDTNGFLTRIVGTKYDFGGKADYITKIAKENLLTPREILYIGNSINDTSVYKSGADTLCVNPHFTDPTNKTQWKDYIPNMTTFKDIIDFVHI